MANAEDFADYPMSLGERRSDKDNANASKWTPRDALISVLRRIDKGEIKPDAIVIAIREKESEGVTRTYFSNAASDIHTSLGLLAHVQYRLLNTK